MKIKPMVEVFTQSVMMQYAEICGWTVSTGGGFGSDGAGSAGLTESGPDEK